MRWYFKAYVLKNAWDLRNLLFANEIAHVALITSVVVPVSQVLRENIRREPWKLGQPHEPMSWLEETDGDLRDEKVKAERR